MAEHLKSSHDFRREDCPSVPSAQAHFVKVWGNGPRDRAKLSDLLSLDSGPLVANTVSQGYLYELVSILVHIRASGTEARRILRSCHLQRVHTGLRLNRITAQKSVVTTITGAVGTTAMESSPEGPYLLQQNILSKNTLRRSSIDLSYHCRLLLALILEQLADRRLVVSTRHRKIWE